MFIYCHNKLLALKSSLKEFKKSVCRQYRAQRLFGNKSYRYIILIHKMKKFARVLLGIFNGKGCAESGKQIISLFNKRGDVEIS